MPYPEAGESERDYLKRCIPETIDEGYPRRQGIAICYSKYRKYGTEAKSPKPEKKSYGYENPKNSKKKRAHALILLD